MEQNFSIAFICHPYHRGGVTSWMRSAAAGFAARGCRVFFVTVDPVKPFHSGRGREKMADLVATHEGVQLIKAPAGFTFEFGTEDYRADVYRRLIARGVPRGVPLIVSDDNSVWKAAAALAGSYPMVGVLHGDQDYYYNKAIEFQSQLSVCVCVSGRIRRKAAERCSNMSSSKLYTIPCGIDMPVFSDVAEPHAEGRLIFIGRLTDYEKRAEDLVKICAAMHAQQLSFHLDIIGNSDESAADFTDKFKARGVDDFVSFHGWRTRPEIQRFLDKADVLLLTSNSEGMPLAMMEGLASGCGFTGTRVSGIEDYEHDPRAADCVSVYAIGDIADAVSKISRILAVPQATRRLAARRLAETEFSMGVCLDRYTTAIENIKTEQIQARKLSLSPVRALQSRVLALARHLKVRLKN